MQPFLKKLRLNVYKKKFIEVTDVLKGGIFYIRQTNFQLYIRKGEGRLASEMHAGSLCGKM
jgi:hypothetical protein